MVRNDRKDNKQGGGTAILIIDGIRFKVIEFIANQELLETTIISIETSNNNCLILTALYAKKGQTSKFIRELEN